MVQFYFESLRSALNEIQNKAYYGSLVHFLYCLKLSKIYPTDLLIKKQAQNQLIDATFTHIIPALFLPIILLNIIFLQSCVTSISLLLYTLCEKCPMTEFFLVRAFASLCFSPNAGKYGPEKTPYLDKFCTVIVNMVVWFVGLVNAFNCWQNIT